MTPPSSTICPRCRRLIDRTEARCPFCGLPSPGGLRPLGSGLGWIEDPERFVRGLIWINGFFFVLSLLYSGPAVRLSADPFTFLSPDTQNLVRLGASGTLPIERLNRWWTLISANYLHGSLLHIFFNMAALNQIAPLILREYGTFRMFSVYTVAGAAGFLASYLAGVPLTIGASAALCGLIGAALYYGRSRGGIYGRTVYRQMAGWTFGLVIIGLLPGINNWAHGGGLLAGAAAGWLLGYGERRPETFAHRLLGGALMLLTAMVLVWAVASATYYRFG